MALARPEFTSQCRSWVETGPGYEVRSTSQTPALHRGHWKCAQVTGFFGSDAILQVLIARDGEQHFHLLRNEDRNQADFCASRCREAANDIKWVWVNTYEYHF